MIKEYFEAHKKSMDQDQHRQPATTGRTSTPAQAYGINQCQSNHMTTTPTHPPTQVAAGPSAPSPYLREQQYAHHYMHQLQQQELHQKLHHFWENQYQEIEQTTDFRNHSLPLARIKKIMKTDKEVKMISAEAPIIFAKASEMFIMELTMRAWANVEENKRRTLQKNDIAAAVTKTDVFDFLVDVVPRDETMDLDLYEGIRRGGNARNENIPYVPYYYYYMPPQQVVGPPYGPPRIVMGRHVPNQKYHVQQTHPFAAQLCPKQQNQSSDSDD